MKLKKLTLADEKIFSSFFESSPRALAVCAFAGVYIWKALYEVLWSVADGNLCIFFKDRLGCFLYLPPLSAAPPAPGVIAEAFAVMDGFNRNPEISRIENAEEHELGHYARLGYAWRYKSSDYVYARQELVGLRGNRFKSKRAGYNHFVAHYSFEYLPFSGRHKQECRLLYRDWIIARREASRDPLYRGMLEDGERCFETLLSAWGRLGIVGRVVKVNGRVRGFTFGYPLNRDTFCILYEITDLSLKGLSQFIFREFCREAAPYPLINAMDDSDLENLKRVKLSYRPRARVPAYIVERKR